MYNFYQKQSVAKSPLCKNKAPVRQSKTSEVSPKNEGSSKKEEIIKRQKFMPILKEIDYSGIPVTLKRHTCSPVKDVKVKFDYAIDQIRNIED